ncbi:hypothetical protein [Enterococcus sp. AZ163]|uniref:hypothetical protein n=1 Tax=Enterococcus sp. AZ163 TaxID=2774638 RepID=UPI003D2CB8D6
MNKIKIAAEDIAFIIDGIIYGEGEGFEDMTQEECDALESFARQLRESKKDFVIMINNS